MLLGPAPLEAQNDEPVMPAPSPWLPRLLAEDTIQSLHAGLAALPTSEGSQDGRETHVDRQQPAVSSTRTHKKYFPPEQWAESDERSAPSESHSIHQLRENGRKTPPLHSTPPSNTDANTFLGMTQPFKQRLKSPRSTCS